LTAAYDYVLGAIDNVAEAVGVDPGEVAGFEPSLDERFSIRFGMSPIAFYEARTLDLKFSDFPARQHAAIGADDANIPDRKRIAAALGPQRRVLADLGDHAAGGFGHAPTGHGRHVGQGIG